jgi:hypothetical protein
MHALTRDKVGSSDQEEAEGQREKHRPARNKKIGSNEKEGDGG